MPSTTDNRTLIIESACFICHKLRITISLKIYFVIRNGQSMITKVGGQAVLGRQSAYATPWLTERHGYDPSFVLSIPSWSVPFLAPLRKDQRKGRGMMSELRRRHDIR